MNLFSVKNIIEAVFGGMISLPTGTNLANTQVRPRAVATVSDDLESYFILLPDPVATALGTDLRT